VQQEPEHLHLFSCNQIMQSAKPQPLSLLKIGGSMRRIFTTLFLFCAFSLQGESSEMLNALSTIHGIFQSGYAPTEWKGEVSGWNLEDAIDQAKQKVIDNPEMTTHEFQQVVADFLRSTHDYHVGVFFTSTESSTLGFSVKSAEGRYFIAHIDRTLLSSESFPFEEGDELLSFGEDTVEKAIQNIKRDTGMFYGPPATEQALAEGILTHREWYRAQECPRGTILLEIRSKESGKCHHHELIWVYEEELAKPLPLREQSILEKLTKSQGIAGFYSPTATSSKQESPHAIGARKSYVPDLGTIKWRSEEWDEFDAYVFENDEGKSIGYLRLPSYSCQWGIEWIYFAELINRFEQETDALIIDQVNNPGGYIFYCYALASMLVTEPMQIPPNREKINQGSLLEAKYLTDLFGSIQNDEEAKALFSFFQDPNIPTTLFGLPITHQFIRNWLEYCKEIVIEWEAGRTYTNPLSFMGLGRLNPSPFASYSKPVLLLINELDFSCGDFFPSILQDAGRVTIMGQRTAGAGGYVLGCDFPNTLGIYAFRYTGSHAIRPNGNPIEDLGCTPDILYTPTVNDLQNNYRDYVGAINETITTMLSTEENLDESEESVE
jgi:hypothetical protein